MDRPNAIALAKREFLRTADDIARYCVGLIEQSDPSIATLTNIGYQAETQSYGYSFYQEWAVGYADVGVGLIARTSDNQRPGCELIVTPGNSVRDTVFGSMDPSIGEQALVGSSSGSVRSLAAGRSAMRAVWTRELQRLGYRVAAAEQNSVAGQQIVSGVLTGILTGGLVSATAAETNVQSASKGSLQIEIATVLRNQAQFEVIRLSASQ